MVVVCASANEIVFARKSVDAKIAIIA
jgi:hypothetical protein